MTAPAIPLCPTPDTHPVTCPCPRRSAETYYGHPIATTPDISTYQEQHVTQPEPIRKSLLPCTPPPEWEFSTVLGAPHGCMLLPGDDGPIVIRRRASFGDWEPVRPDHWAPEPAGSCTAAAEVSVPNNSGETGCHCGLGTRNDCATKPWGCANDQGHATPDDPSQSRTAPDLPAGGGDAVDNPGGACECGRSPDPGVCPGNCAMGERFWTHCLCACDGTEFEPATPLGSSAASSNEPSSAVGTDPVATPRNALDLRERVSDAVDEGFRLYAELEDVSLGGSITASVLDALAALPPLPDRAQAAIRALEQQRDAREERLAAIQAELDDQRKAKNTAAGAADRFRDVLAEALGHAEENPGDDVLVAELREHFGKTGPEPTRWRDFLTSALAVVDQINAGKDEAEPTR